MKFYFKKNEQKTYCFKKTNTTKMNQYYFFCQLNTIQHFFPEKNRGKKYEEWILTVFEEKTLKTITKNDEYFKIKKNENENIS